VVGDFGVTGVGALVAGVVGLLGVVGNIAGFELAGVDAAGSGVAGSELGVVLVAVGVAGPRDASSSALGPDLQP
jgi:hypothetical protein